MYKLETKFQFFRLNNRQEYNKGPYNNIVWYVLENDGVEEDARCFKDMAELKEFQNYTVKNTLNFPPNGKDYSNCDNEETPYCGIMSGLEAVSFPTRIILRKKPQISSDKIITECMDIILTDQNGSDKHSYDLDFDVIGIIEV